ncbi:MAG: undecaprenyldiphospho-muramoylpentapeptide beta-N-acetylglucosaminyltransferase [Clostridiales bacterium]|nr:undecaprenyldiphospho-muramoylpentapeptide beta-N-acetylglucosaminyltransferase [Clostridiales bacterium]
MQKTIRPYSKDPLRVVVSGGGTGGHIYPALAIAAALRERCGADILYLGGKASPQGSLPKEKELALAAGWDYKGVSAVGLSRRFPHIAGDIITNIRGVGEAREILRCFSPCAVIGTGGYAMAPTLRAAVSLGLPTLLHEQNAYPGRANRYLAGKVDTVCISFAAAKSYFPASAHVILSGLPVREAIMTAGREAAYEFFGIEETERKRPTLLVTGGSQGAHRLNEAICGCYKELLAAGLRIIHLTGETHYKNCLAAAVGLRQENLYILPYLKEMQNALVLADLAVARAGASFLSEAAIAALPTILIPYPYAANDHQTLNARAFVKAGAARMIPDDRLDSAELACQALGLLDGTEEIRQMSQAAKSLARPDALDSIINAVYELVK